MGESLPLRVDFIHRVEFEEVCGHRVHIKKKMRNIFPFQVSVNLSVYSHNKLDQLIIAQSSRYQPHKSHLA